MAPLISSPAEAPGGWNVRNAGLPQQAENRAPRPGVQPRRSGFLLLDIVDDFGHVVLVLAELGGVLDQLLLFLVLLERHALFFLFLSRLDLLGFAIGVDLLGA